MSNIPSLTAPELGDRYSPSLLFNHAARTLVATTNLTPPVAARTYALLSLAQEEAWHTHHTDAHDRNSPSDLILISQASYQLLKRLFPDANQSLKDLRDAFFADRYLKSENGSTLAEKGREIAKGILERYAQDGSEEAQKTSHKKRESSLLLPSWGEVKPMTPGLNVDSFVPRAPPSSKSEEFKESLAQIQNYSQRRTQEQLTLALKWVDGTGTSTTPGHWNQIAALAIAESAKEWSEGQITECLAMLNVVLFDTSIVCWRTIYKYDLIRPYQIDTSLTTPAGKLSYPSYVSAHSSFSSAAAQILGFYFPGMALKFRQEADECGEAGVIGCVHYPWDNREGLKLGAAVANHIMRYYTEGEEEPQEQEKEEE